VDGSCRDTLLNAMQPPSLESLGELVANAAWNSATESGSLPWPPVEAGLVVFSLRRAEGDPGGA